MSDAPVFRTWRRRSRTIGVSVTMVLLALSTGCTASETDAPPSDESLADAMREWVEVSMTLARDEGLSPPEVARLAGYLGLGMHEAILTTRDGDGSLAGEVPGLESLPRPPRDLNQGVALAVVAEAVLQDLLATTTSHTRIDEVASEQLEVARQGLDGADAAAANEHGSDIADQIRDRAAGDGYNEIDGQSFAPAGGEGTWAPTPPDFGTPLEPYWGRVDLFLGHEHCAVSPPPPYDLTPDSVFRADVDQVHAVSLALSDEQRAIADFWNDLPVATAAPPGHWWQIASAVTADQKLDGSQTAQVLALSGMALADAAVSAWHWKYTYNVVRPITTVRSVANSEWTPYITTPPFPEYPSGHSTFSAAVATVLADTTRDEGFVDQVNVDVVGAERSYESYKEAADEAGMSRVYGGIHYPFGNRAGAELGRCIGDQALSTAAASS